MTTQPKKPLTKQHEDLLWEKHYEELRKRKDEEPKRYKRNQ